MKFFNARRNAYHTDPKQLEDVIYTPYMYDPPAQGPEHATPVTPAVGPTGDLLGIPELQVDGEAVPVNGENGQERRARKKSKFDAPERAEVFVFKYGTVVIWGMTEAQEKRFLSSM